MFPNLSAEIARKQMNLKMLSEQTGIKYETLKLKMRGVTEFLLPEMRSIKSVFPHCSMDYLFESDGKIEEV